MSADASSSGRFGWLEPTLKAGGVILAACGVIGAQLVKYDADITKPQYGRTVDHTVPAAGMAAGWTHQRYEVYNPGPGELANIVLHAELKEKYDSQAGNYGPTLEVKKPLDVDESHGMNGNNCIVAISPRKGTALKPRGRLFLEFVASAEKWNPLAIQISGIGPNTVDASQPMPDLGIEYQPFWVRWLWSVTLLLLGLALTGAMFLRQHYRKVISSDTAAARRVTETKLRAEFAASKENELIKWVKTQLLDVTGDSGPYRDAIQQAQQPKGPPPAVPAPPPALPAPPQEGQPP